MFSPHLRHTRRRREAVATTPRMSRGCHQATHLSRTGKGKLDLVRRKPPQLQQDGKYFSFALEHCWLQLCILTARQAFQKNRRSPHLGRQMPVLQRQDWIWMCSPTKRLHRLLNLASKFFVVADLFIWNEKACQRRGNAQPVAECSQRDLLLDFIPVVLYGHPDALPLTLTKKSIQWT